MANGCGPCDNHGAGCGVQLGMTAGCEMGVTIPGNGVKPAGIPIPLLNGVNDAPAGFGANAGCVRFGSMGTMGAEKTLPSTADAGLGASNCRNRSIAASCSRFGFSGVCGADALNESQLTVPFCFGAAPLFHQSPGGRPGFCPGLPVPSRPAPNSPALFWSCGKSHGELARSFCPSSLGAVRCFCFSWSKKRSNGVRLSTGSAVSFLSAGATPNISSGVICSQFLRSAAVFFTGCRPAADGGGGGGKSSGVLKSKSGDGARDVSGRLGNCGLADAGGGVTDGVVPFGGAEKIMGCPACCAAADKTIAPAATTSSGHFSPGTRKSIFNHTH